MSTTFSEILTGFIRESDHSLSVNVPENWMQGRTTYGGLSAAICVQAALDLYPDLPPLRSAQINFIGPVGGSVKIQTKVLRRGRSVAYISAEMTGEKGLATHAVFCFGEARESRLNQDFTRKPNVPSVEESQDFFKRAPGPKFAENFDCLLSKGGMPVSGSKDSEHFIWVRHKDDKAYTLAGLIGLADMPPPAVLPMFEEFAPVSSMTWMMNFLTDDYASEEGWWLMRSAAEHARDGYSSQDMQVWNKAGDLVITGRQNVAVFY